MSEYLTVPFEVANISPQESFDKAFEIFVNELKNRENRPNLLGKFLFIDERNGAQGKDEGFWHIASIGEDEDDAKFDMLPCQNHNAQSKCEYLCEANNDANFLQEIKRIPCIYRAHKINWIKEIIDLTNSNPKHPNLRIWKQKTKKDKRLLIRYVDGAIDFVLLFAIVYNQKRDDIHMYKLITGYPVVLKSYKRRFDKEYGEEQKKRAK